MKKRRVRVLIRNFVIELILYSVLVLAYSFGVLQWLSDPLCRLFQTNTLVYGIVALGLIVAQGTLLDFITMFLLDQLPLERLE